MKRKAKEELEDMSQKEVENYYYALGMYEVRRKYNPPAECREDTEWNKGDPLCLECFKGRPYGHQCPSFRPNRWQRT